MIAKIADRSSAGKYENIRSIEYIRQKALVFLAPPERIPLDEWIQENVVLPASIAAHPGKLKLWPHQVEIARSIGDMTVERVSLLKAARTGYTQLLVAAIGHYAVNDPGPILVVVPAEEDARKLMTGTIEPTFGASPNLRTSISENLSSRDTLYNRRFAGGSLSLVSAGAERNLRAATARVLLLDEIDSYETDVGGNGDPVNLAIRRTMTYSPRKIVMGSTPVHADTSKILRAFSQGDQRLFKCECPSCGERHEIRWKDIHWTPDSGGSDAHWACPSCGGIVEEGPQKTKFIQSGIWEAQRPEVKNHHSYRMSALISLLPNASWPVIVAEFLEAKKTPETLQAWTNTVLGEAWEDQDGESIDERMLYERRETFDLEAIPADVLTMTAGLDVQPDRVEMCSIGWNRDGGAFVLAHEVIWGDTLDNGIWIEIGDMLARSFRHPNGGTLRYDAAIVDSGGQAGTTDVVYAFCKSRGSRRVFAGKGVAGFTRPAVSLATNRNVRLQIIGVDGLKAGIAARLRSGTTVRFSDTLTETWFEQLCAEKLVTRFARGQPSRQWVRIPGRAAEALDCVVYAFAARHLLTGIDLERRSNDLLTAAAPKQVQTVFKSSFLNR